MIQVVPRIDVKALLLDIDLRIAASTVHACAFVYEAARETTRILTELWPSASSCANDGAGVGV